MAAPDPLVMPLARELLECFEQEILKVTTSPLYIGLRSGSVVDIQLSGIEDEGCSGLAWVRPVSFYPSSGVFPAQDEGPLPKGTGAWAVTLEMGAVRCVPTPDANSIITNDQWDVLTQAVMDDAAAMRRALCCFADLAPRRLKQMIPGIWQPLSVEGGATGGVLSVTVLGPACDCSEAGPASS
jgi:hypothetical protein